MSNQVLDRMLSNVEATSKSEGTLIYDALSPVSKEIEKVNNNIDDALNKVFAKTALEKGYSEFLEMRCNEDGVFRKVGIKASGTVTFTGATGTIIGAGTLVQTEDNLQFETTVEVIIPTSGSIDVNVAAVEIGSRYNVMANTIVTIPIPLIGISTINNTNSFINGIDIENDIDLYKRYKLKVTTPATSGNANHYKLWSLEVNGVGDARVKPLWNGNGTVKVIVIDSNKRTPSETIITSVTDNIENQRPIGPTVTVVGVVELNININVNVEITSSVTLDVVKNSINANVTEYLKNNAESIVRYTKIANCILDAEGVIDYSNLTVNNGTANVTITDEQVAVIGTVVVTNAT